MEIFHKPQRHYLFELNTSRMDYEVLDNIALGNGSTFILQRSRVLNLYFVTTANSLK